MWFYFYLIGLKNISTSNIVFEIKENINVFESRFANLQELSFLLLLISIYIVVYFGTSSIF